nr:MAG TPA: protein of unknown function (DUF4376) [Caudoviricetes sp.]
MEIVILWVDKITGQFFKMDGKPSLKEDVENFDCIEVNEEAFNKYEEMKAEGHILVCKAGKIEIQKEIFDRKLKIDQIKKELYELRLEYDVAPFEFEVGGVKYLQNNRSIDQSNLTRIVVMCQAMKKTEFENWKFYTKDNSEKYVNLTLQDMLRMANIMQAHTTKAMATETLLSHNLENLTDKELKEYDAKDRYEKAYKNM